MIKRIIACLTICLIITGLLSPVISHAEPVPIYTPNWSDPGIAEIIDISDLTGWMANGGVFDITDFQDLEEFMGWYFKLRVPMQDENGEVYFAPYYGYDYSLSTPDPDIDLKFNKQSQVRGMINRSYQNKVGYGRRLQEQVDKALLEDGDLTNVLIPLLDFGEAASFIGYDVNAINRYKQQFISDIHIEPNPDDDYYNYVVLLNSDRFTYGSTIIEPPLGSYTAVSCNNSSGTISGSLTFNSNQYDVLAFPFFSIYINYNVNDNLWYLSHDSISFSDVLSFNDYYQNSNHYGNCLFTTSNVGNAVYTFTLKGNLNFLDGSFNSLDEALTYACKHYNKVNLYVNGILWASMEEDEEDIVPEFPDVVGGEELPVITWPLTYPKAPSYINLPGLNQAFQRAKNTDNKFDIMDLKDSLVDPEGDPIVDPEMETVPIPLPNPDPINPEVVPELPDLPLIPPANNPGFSGVSVLAEIINFTNQSLPSALITVFWGVIFGVVILGLIKILHK